MPQKEEAPDGLTQNSAWRLMLWAWRFASFEEGGGTIALSLDVTSLSFYVVVDAVTSVWPLRLGLGI